MSLELKVLSMSQQVSFDTGDVSNFVTLQLPDGSTIMALVTDTDATRLVAAVQAKKKIFDNKTPPPPLHGPAAQTEVASQTGPVFAPRPPEDSSFVFGEETGPTGLPPLDAEEDEPIVPPQIGTAARARTVPSNEAGFPIAPQRVQEERETDEDGVPGM